MSQELPSPLCATERDSTLHFFFACSLIQQVWTLLAVRFFDHVRASIIQFLLFDKQQVVFTLADILPQHSSIQQASAITPPQIATYARQNS
ncbi:hypothetical protein BY458DRAFT_68890 [Sporodiniella umbellata]|nr:hypothetical protein BY458DRAFT_68890 [Sporodiniella umbellata]